METGKKPKLEEAWLGRRGGAGIRVASVGTSTAPSPAPSELASRQRDGAQRGPAWREGRSG